MERLAVSAAEANRLVGDVEGPSLAMDWNGGCHALSRRRPHAPRPLSDRTFGMARPSPNTEQSVGSP
jgi:hypothetical protein